MFDFIDLLNIGTTIMALGIALFAYRQYKIKVLAPLYTFLVMIFALHIVIFYGVVLYVRWIWDVQTSTLFQDWSAILRSTEVLCVGLLAVSMVRFRGKGGKN